MKIFTMRIFSLFFLISIVLSDSVFAQGTLRGVVTDSLNGETLIGANVILMGTAIGAATDIEGEFRIQRIPEGNYTLKVSYVGYRPKEFTVSIVGTRTTQFDVQLLPDILEGQEILITAQALGQAAAINQQLSSNTIVNVVSQEKIQQLPDANAAEAIGRLPGVALTRSGGEASQVVMRGLSSKYSSITIDGVRISSTESNNRGVDLSAISQGSLAGIELFKALTSDKDADALAGTVNLVTRKAPSQRAVRIETKGNYNGLEKSAGQYNFNARYSERFFDDLLGVQVSGNVERVIRSNENTDYNFREIGSNLEDWNWSNFVVQYTDEVRERNGGSLILDFNTPDNGSIRFSNTFNQTNRDFLTHQRNYTTGGVTYDYRLREREIGMFTSSLRGENHLLGLDIDWNISFSQSKVNPIVDFEMDFNESSTEKSGMDPNMPSQYLKGPLDAWIPYAYNNFDIATINWGTDRSEGNYEKEKTALLNILRKYTLSNNITGEIKIGGKLRSKYRDYSNYEAVATYYLWAIPRYVRLEDGTFKLKDFSGTPFDGLVNTSAVPMRRFLDDVPQDRNVLDQYRLYPLISRDKFKLWRDLNVNGFNTPVNQAYDTNAEFLVNNGTVANAYTINENLLAGYLMNTLNFGQAITFIAGVRIESDNNDYSAYFSPLKLGGFNWAPYGLLKRIEVNHKETVVLPNFQMIVKPTNFLNLRFAGYQAMARPDFNHRLPRFVAVAASSPYLRIGNPQLKNAVAWNLEAQAQFFGNDIGLFSINAFYKDIKDLQRSVEVQGKGTKLIDSLGVDWRMYTDTFPFGPNDTYNFTYSYNLEQPTRVWGFEVEHQANFRFLPGLLKNIVLDYNLTVIRAETWRTIQRDVQIPRPPFPPLQEKRLFLEKTKLEDQPEFRANVSIGYDYEGFSFRLSCSHQGEYTRNVSTSQRSDDITNALTRWDISATQQVTSYLKLLLNLNNITNAKEVSSVYNRLMDWPQLQNNANLYGFTVDFGARIDL